MTCQRQWRVALPAFRFVRAERFAPQGLELLDLERLDWAQPTANLPRAMAAPS